MHHPSLSLIRQSWLSEVIKQYISPAFQRSPPDSSAQRGILKAKPQRRRCADDFNILSSALCQCPRVSHLLCRSVPPSSQHSLSSTADLVLERLAFMVSALTAGPEPESAEERDAEEKDAEEEECAAKTPST